MAHYVRNPPAEPEAAGAEPPPVRRAGSPAGRRAARAGPAPAPGPAPGPPLGARVLPDDVTAGGRRPGRGLVHAEGGGRPDHQGAPLRDHAGRTAGVERGPSLLPAADPGGGGEG